MAMTKGILDFACERLSNIGGDIRELMWINWSDKSEDKKLDIAEEAYIVIRDDLIQLKEINEKYKKEFCVVQGGEK